MSVTSVALPSVEATFKAVARHIPVLCWLCRHDRTRAYFSVAWKAYTGNEYSDGRWRECVHPDDRSAFDGLQCGCEIGVAAYREVRIRSKFGAYRWHRVTCTPAADDGDLPEAHIFVAFDIQDERDALAEAEKARQRLALATEAAKVGVYEIDPVKRTAIWNERVARTFGIPLEAFDGRLDTMRGFLLPDDRAEVETRIDEMVRDGIPTIALQYRVRRPDGEIRHIRSFLLTSVNVEGALTLHGALVDWTENYNNDKRLRDYKNRLQATYDGAGVGIKEIGPDGRVLRVNQAWEAITGRTPDEVVGQIFWEEAFELKEQQDAAKQGFLRLVAGEIDTEEMVSERFNPKAGTTIWTQSRMTAVRDEHGHFLYAIRVLNDITELQRLNEHMRLLLAELTHRVKNSMATVQSIAMQTAPTDDDFRETFCARIHTLSAVHDLNIKGDYFGASVEDILAAVMRQRLEAPSANWSFKGPTVLINPAAAVNFGLIMHELAYNAVSYGSLTDADGRLDVTWEVVGTGNNQVLRIEWRESGGPEVEPPEYRGFGTRFVTTFSRHLQGSYQPDYRPDGVVIVLEIPTTTILAKPSPGLMRL